ncbi:MULTISPECIES: PIN domain-containing protein [unclassified Mesorhizobium]|uniref:PIN domain-containing protein n=1 Tax=unclassified Mesorhizobium TaxID=325217 RepID=UPI000FC9F7DE|nr:MULTISPECIES: PIN domain-containing protein [unclassified Mesorhizobium]RUW91127.1 PIN domain-containing protein [Mesorhizobium sp. M7A.F.Ca.US.010.02.1.1]RUX25990.1 PIN domain-containing protein [Mesorhizobium sp. M7A.F.Ca.US.011.01.1.1]
MIADCFLDTNILVYAAIGHKAERAKYERAVELIAKEDYSTSAQVLQEFYVNVTKRAEVTLAPAKAAEWVAAISMKPCQDLDSAVVMRGIANAQRYQISYWDGAIIAAAERLGVKILYTEDLNHGQSYGSVVAMNPFRNH